MERILVVDDDLQLASLLVLSLREAGLAARAAHTGTEALEQVRSWNPDLILLDLLLPDVEGWEVCRRIRASSRVPIVMVTGRGAEEDRLRGFAEGADDYVVKPFYPRELVARVKAHLRRAQEPPLFTGLKRLTCPGFVLDRESYALEVNGAPVDVTPKEFELLWLLASNPGRAIPRDHVLEQVWGYEAGNPRTLEVYIARLRAKLGPLRGWLKTVRGVGYKFEVPLR